MELKQSEYLEALVTILQRCGVWPQTSKDFLLGIILMSNMALLCILLMAAMDPSNIEEFTFSGAFFVNAFIFIVKVSVLMANQKKCRHMVQETRKRCALLVAEFPEHRNLLDSKAQRVHKITITLIAAMSIIYVGWTLLPFLAIFNVVPESFATLPVSMGYTMDLKRHKNLLIAMFHQMASLFLMAGPYVTANMLYIGFISLTCGQLQILSLGFQTLNKKKLTNRLHFCISMHSSILRFGKEMESLMSPILLVVFAAYVAIICQSLIQLSSSAMASERNVKFVGYLTILLIEVWLYCYFGNQLIDYSTEIQKAVYSSTWYEFDESNKKSLALVILRSQRPLRLTLGKMYIVSLGTFTEVMKLCFSMFTLLMEVNHRK